MKNSRQRSYGTATDYQLSPPPKDSRPPSHPRPPPPSGTPPGHPPGRPGPPTGTPHQGTPPGNPGGPHRDAPPGRPTLADSMIHGRKLSPVNENSPWAVEARSPRRNLCDSVRLLLPMRPQHQQPGHLHSTKRPPATAQTRPTAGITHPPPPCTHGSQPTARSPGQDRLHRRRRVTHERVQREAHGPERRRARGPEQRRARAREQREAHGPEQRGTRGREQRRARGREQRLTASAG